MDQSNSPQCVRGQANIVMMISDMFLHILLKFDMVFAYSACGQMVPLFKDNASNIIGNKKWQLENKMSSICCWNQLDSCF